MSPRTRKSERKDGERLKAYVARDRGTGRIAKKKAEEGKEVMQQRQHNESKKKEAVKVQKSVFESVFKESYVPFEDLFNETYLGTQPTIVSSENKPKHQSQKEENE